MSPALFFCSRRTTKRWGGCTSWRIYSTSFPLTTLQTRILRRYMTCVQHMYGLSQANAQPLGPMWWRNAMSIQFPFHKRRSWKILQCVESVEHPYGRYEMVVPPREPKLILVFLRSTGNLGLFPGVIHYNLQIHNHYYIQSYCATLPRSIPDRHGFGNAVGK